MTQAQAINLLRSYLPDSYEETLKLYQALGPNDAPKVLSWLQATFHIASGRTIPRKTELQIRKRLTVRQDAPEGVQNTLLARRPETGEQLCIDELSRDK